VWTGNVGRAIRVAKGIRTGVLSVNSHKSVRTETPFGGYKRSGLGRELGMHAMDHYTEVKNVYFASD
jgi:betaine-aldehyde dehydrogenase